MTIHSLILLYILCTILFVHSFLLFIKDKFHCMISSTIVSLNKVYIKSGDIIKVGLTHDGSIAAHWINSVLHHYLFIQDIEGVLYVIHTWYRNIKSNNNILIDPYYSMQPLKDYIQYSKMTICEIFRHPIIPHKNITISEVKSIFINYNMTSRCYITIISLLDNLYPELNIQYDKTDCRSLTTRYLWILTFYKAADFDEFLRYKGFQKYKDIILLDNLIVE